MDLGFVAPDLRRLDRLQTGALVLYHREGDVPLPDVRGLVDWRLCGTLSRLVLQGRMTGAADETILMPVGHRLSCERLLVLGLGPPEPLETEALERHIRRALHVLARIRVHAATMVLPGRPFGGTDPVAAIEALLRASAEEPEVDEVVLVEDLAGQKAMDAILDVERRRG